MIRPINFSAPMIRALLDGRKTQTRRVLSRAWPVLGASWRGRSNYAAWSGLRFAEAEARNWPGDPHIAVPWCHPSDEPTPSDECGIYRVRPPFEVGDRLWVREAWAPVPSSAYRQSEGVEQRVNPDDPDRASVYKAGWNRSKPLWKSPIHMPRWASRLTLTVTDVRVQRVQQISSDDAVAEGIEENRAGLVLVEGGLPMTAKAAFRRLWNSIHGPDAWDRNDWVAAYTFSVEHRNFDQ